MKTDNFCCGGIYCGKHHRRDYCAILLFRDFRVPGAFAYRVVNTLDSMVATRTRKTKNIGWFSANLDTIANYIPARFTGLLMVHPRSFGEIGVNHGHYAA